MSYVALIPAFNEEKNIGEVILKVKENPKFSIIVVDDGSKDKTSEIAKKFGAIVLRHEKNKGKGEALKSGFNYILKKMKNVKYVVTIDADMQYHPRDAFKVLEVMSKEKLDFVMGMRYPNQIPYANRMGNFGWRIAFNIFFGTNFRDIGCGVMGFSKNSLKKIKNIYGGYIIESSILIQVIKNKLKYKQVFVNVKYGKRKIHKFARMFFGVLFFIVFEGLKYRLKIGN